MAKTPVDTPAAPIPQPTGRWAVAAYAGLSLFSLAIALLTGWWIVTQSDVLGVRFDRAYYILLAILGLAAALMLFGAMRSAANVQGQHLGVAFDVGGPAALFVLVVAGGAWLTQPPSSFNAQIRLHYAGPESDHPLFDAALSSAKLRVSIGFSTSEPQFSSQGEVTVWNIPGRFRDGKFSAELISDRIALSEPAQAQALHFLGPDQAIELRAVLKELSERRADREQARDDLRKIIESVQMTLYGKDGLLFPAIDNFLQSPSDANWQRVLAADARVQGIVQAGLDAAVRYDAKWGGLFGEPQRIRIRLASTANVPFQSLPSQLGPLVPAWAANNSVLGHVPDPRIRDQVIQWRDQLHKTYQQVLEALMPLADKLAAPT